MVCRAIVDHVLDGDVAAVRRYGVRFAGVVYPGETLWANIWTAGDRLLATVTAPDRDDATVRSGVELVPA
jgi:acyl dehydratase